MNIVAIIGNLVRDPESRTTQSGKQVTTFTVAVNKRTADGNAADFIPVITWEKTADNCAKYLAKGRKVAVEGSLQTRTYEGGDGNKHTVMEVVASSVQFLSTQSQKEQETQTYERSDALKAQAQKEEFKEADDDDELPF